MKRIVTGVILTLGLLVVAQPGLAREKGDWMARLRAIDVSPNDDSSAVTTIDGSSVSVDDDWVPELDFSYMLTDNWGLELILATSTHSVSGEDSIVGLGEIVETEVLPPTLTVQYHFSAGEKVMPYVGAGVNYTLFYDEESTPSLETALGDITTIDTDDSFGFAVQAGTDIAFSERWFFNIDVKYIMIDTTAELNTDGTIRTVDIDIDPLVFGVGVGLKF